MKSPLLETALARCQCQTCGRVFSSVSAFDKHRVTLEGKRVCAEPSTVGLEAKQWGGFGGVGSFERSEA
jgi:hypothetical protein